MFMRGSRKFNQRGSKFDNAFFLVFLFFFFFLGGGGGGGGLLMSGGRIKIPLLASHHRPASETPFEMAFLWRADDGSTLNAGLVAL